MKTDSGNLPSLFIASSSESLPVVEILCRRLASDARVTPWNHPSVFQPTNSYIGELLLLSQRFDFGVFLLEPDDIVISRGKRAAAPRDNVNFELGLFMAHLGMKRALPMAPRGKVKILSDYSGWEPVQYTESKDLVDLRKRLANAKTTKRREALSVEFNGKLSKALTPAVVQIRKLLKQGPIEKPGAFADAPNVTRVGETLERLVGTAVHALGSADVRHLALDMSEAWGILKDEVLQSKKQFKGVTWRCLMIDPESETIKRMSSESVNVDVAAKRIAQMRDFFSKRDTELAARRIKFECRAYKDPSLMHGFLIDGTALLWSSCGVVNGELDASSAQYWRFDTVDQHAPSYHTARSFGSWFEHWWQQGRHIWPLESESK